MGYNTSCFLVNFLKGCITSGIFSAIISLCLGHPTYCCCSRVPSSSKRIWQQQKMPKLEKLWEKNRREMNDKLYDIIITKVMLVFFLPSVLLSSVSTKWQHTKTANRIDPWPWKIFTPLITDSLVGPIHATLKIGGRAANQGGVRTLKMSFHH